MQNLAKVASRSGTPVPAHVLSQFEVLSHVSIQFYPSIASAYLFGALAPTRPDSDVDIAILVPDFHWDELGDIGGAYEEGSISRCLRLMTL